MLDPKFSIPGDFEADDVVVAVVAARLLGQELSKELAKSAAGFLERIEALQKLAQASPDVRRALGQERIARHFYYGSVDRPEQAVDALVQAKQFIDKPTPISAATLNGAKKEIRSRVRRLHQDLSDRYGFKLDIGLSDIAGLIGIWSVLFLITGYFYTSSLLRALGVNASVFLDVGDYIGASVDQIRVAGESTAWALLIFLTGAFDGSRKSNAQIRNERPTHDRIKRSLWVLVFVAAGAAVWSYWTDKPMFFNIASFLGGLVSLGVADYIAGRAFKKPVYAAALLTALFTFAVGITTAVSRQVYQIEMGTWKSTMNASVELKEPEDGDLSSAVLLFGAGNYLFFIEQGSRKVIVIPRDRVKRIEINPEQTP
jgi:hypothetical protein